MFPSFFVCAPPAGCSIRWTFHRGKCYFFSVQEKTWKASQRDCSEANSNLVIINNKEKLVRAVMEGAYNSVGNEQWTLFQITSQPVFPISGFPMQVSYLHSSKFSPSLLVCTLPWYQCRGTIFSVQAQMHYLPLCRLIKDTHYMM